MAVNLSPIWGAGAQLLDNSGNVLSGGKIYTYAAGTTTPAVTYTSSNGLTANSNPIILNSAGRVPYEIWLTQNIRYKYVLKDSSDTLIGTYDDLIGINDTAFTHIVNFTGDGNTISFTLPITPLNENWTQVFINGVYQFKNTYSVSGTSLIFSEAPPDASKIEVGVLIMADKKISQLPAATTPLAGTEVLPIVQSGVTDKVTVANLTAGRSVSVADLTATTGNLIIGTSGKGIDFSITPGTGTSELFADYEEGTYTSTIGNGWTVGDGTESNRIYTKIGRQVTVNYKIVFGSTSTFGSGQVPQIRMPFISSDTTSRVIGYAHLVDNGTTRKIGIVILTGGEYATVFYSNDVSGAVVNNSPWTWAAGDSIEFVVTYMV